MRIRYSRWLAAIGLAAMAVPAATSASVNACIEACASGFIPADSACERGADESTQAAVSTDCCTKPKADPGQAAATHAADSSCACDTCSLAASRYFTQQAPSKLAPISPVAVLPDVLFVPVSALRIHPDPARESHHARGPSRAQLCVYLI